MTTYSVNELFQSVQGEGLLAGTPATFIRLQGCSVGCAFCDTKYTWAGGGKLMAAEEIVLVCDPIRPLVVITGGEPTLYDLDELIHQLRSGGQNRWGYDFRIQLETSGQNNLKGRYTPDFLTWSPKANLEFNAPKSIKAQAAEVKWVVDGALKLQTVESRMREVDSLSPRFATCVLMPEGTPPSQEYIVKALSWLDKHPDWRYSDRLQFRLGIK